MYYKKEINGNWLKGSRVILPNGAILTEENKKEVDGWKWHDVAPTEYKEWVENQEK